MATKLIDAASQSLRVQINSVPTSRHSLYLSWRIPGLCRQTEQASAMLDFCGLELTIWQFQSFVNDWLALCFTFSLFVVTLRWAKQNILFLPSLQEKAPSDLYNWQLQTENKQEERKKKPHIFLNIIQKCLFICLMVRAWISLLLPDLIQSRSSCYISIDL